MLKNYAHRVTSSDLKYTTFKISGFFTNLATGKGSKEYDELKVTLANMGLSRDFVNAFADFNKAMNRYLDYPEISNTLLTLNIEQFEEDYNKIKDKNSEEFKDFAKSFLYTMQACNKENLPKVNAYEQGRIKK